MNRVFKIRKQIAQYPARIKNFIKNNSRLLLVILVPLLILLIALIQGNLLVWRLFALSVFVIGANFLVLHLGKKGLSGRLINPGHHYQAGSTFEINAEIVNNSILPRPFIRLKLVTRLPVINNNAMINLHPGGIYYWQIKVDKPQRGHYKLGPLIAELSDPFGLLRVPNILDREADVLIYPRVVDLSAFWTGFKASSGIGENNWFNRGSGNVIFGVREYAPGDGLNRIHWRSTAHTGQLIVKEFDSDQAKKVWVILDLNRRSHTGKGLESTEEYSITIAASVLKRYVDTGCYVGLITQTDTLHIFQPRGGYPNLWKMHEALAVFHASGETPFHEIVQRAAGYLDGNSIAVIITPAYDEKVIESIVHIQKRGIPAVLVLIDAESFNSRASAGRNLILPEMLPIHYYLVKKGDDLSEILNKQGKIFSLKFHAEVHGIG